MDKDITVIGNDVVKVAAGLADLKKIIVDAAGLNRDSVVKCVQFGERLLAEAGGGMDDKMDAKIAKYLSRVKETLKALNERRKPVTQAFDMVKKGFTALENEISAKNEDTVVFKLQKVRDDYAALKLEEQRRIAEEQRRLELIRQTKAQLKQDVIDKCYAIYDSQLSESTRYLNMLFANMTIDVAGNTRKAIADYPEALELGKKVKGAVTIPAIVPEAEAKAVLNGAYKEVSDKIMAEYKSNVAKMKSGLLMRFDSKVKNLREIERKRKEDSEAAAKMEAEIKRRDEEEAARKAAEQKAEEEKRKQAEALSRKTAAADLLGMQTCVAPVKASVKKAIEVINPSGWLNIMQLWWTEEGVNMTEAQREKKLGFMKKACESLANKKEVFIESANLAYRDDVKAK